MSPSVVQIVQESATCAYMIVPALTILVYDIIRVFPREVAYIWSAKWQGSKFLYIGVRYLALLGLWSEIMVFLKHQSSIANCRLFIWWHITFGGPALMSILVNCILALRLYALYERKKSVLVVLCSLIATEILCHIYVIVRLGPMVTNSVFTLPPEIPVLGCLTAGPPLRFTLIAWIPAVVLALIFFSMMVYKIQSQIFISIRQSKALALNSGPAMCFSPLLKTFWMDGISSFVLVSASTIVSTVLCLSTTGPFLALSQPWQTLIVSVSGTRLLLHIREVSASGDPLSVGVSRPLEPIRFASRNLDQNANLSMTPDVHHSV